MKRKLIVFIIVNALVLPIIPLILLIIFEFEASGVRKWDEKAFKEGFEDSKGYVNDHDVITIDGVEYQVIDFTTEGYLAYENFEGNIKTGGFAIYYTETEECIYIESMPETFYGDAGEDKTIPIVEMHKVIKYDEALAYGSMIAILIGVFIQPIMAVWLFLIIFLGIRKVKKQ